MSYKEALARGDSQEGQRVPLYSEWLSHHLNEPWQAHSSHPADRFAKESVSLKDSLHPAAWMGRCRTAIDNRPLRSVILPGAHDSGTYSLSNKSQYGTDLKSVKALRALSAIGLGKVTKGIVAVWAVCQSADTRTQLVNGVRYFDLRVSALKDEFFIWHGLCGERIESVLTEMANFAKTFPTEVIIVDLVPHHFDSFEPHHHTRFAELLFEIFGPLLCDSTKLNAWSTMGEFWSSKTNVIVLYEPNIALSSKFSHLWWKADSLHSTWPSHVKNPQQWLTWAASHLAQRTQRLPLWVLQGVITPDAGIITKLNGVSSVEDLSRLLNPKALDFLLQSLNYDHNIIMLDFYNNCALTNLAQWANCGGQPIFTDPDLLYSPGHQSHFQAIVAKHTNGETGVVGAALKSNGDWVSACMNPSELLPWTTAPSLTDFCVRDMTYHSTMRLFTMDGSAYGAMCTPSGALVLRFHSPHPQIQSWTRFALVDAFGSSHGFDTPSPQYRATFSVLSSKDSHDHQTSQGAWITALTTKGIAVARLTPSSSDAFTHIWTPPESMLRPYFTIYAPPSVREYYLALEDLFPNEHHQGDANTTISASKSTVTGEIKKPYLMNTPSNVHTAYTQVCPFVIGNALYLFVQGPVKTLFPRAPTVYRDESIAFVCRFNSTTNTFDLLAIDGLPPPVHRGSRTPNSTEIPEDLLIGSPWIVETTSEAAYFVCRSSDGIRAWKFDGTIASELPVYKAFLDLFHWHEPRFSASLRTFVLKDRLYFMGRSSAGLALICLQNDVWVPAPGMAEFTDFAGWNQDDHIKSLQVTVIGPVAYVTGRCQFGLLTVCFDGAEWRHFERAITYSLV